MTANKSSQRLENEGLENLPAQDRLLMLLKRRGARTAAELGQLLGITGEAVRQQFARLAVEGLVQATAEVRGVGRPVQVWKLTPAANTRFPDAHAELTAQLLRTIRKTLGEAALERVIAARERDLCRSYAGPLRATAGLRERLARLAEIRSAEGYMAEWEADGRAFRLIENHCPIGTATAACMHLCHAELNLFRRVLGPDVDVNREEHILSGARRCTYRIEPKRSHRSLPRDAKTTV